jgi:hypothetical protein
VLLICACTSLLRALSYHLLVQDKDEQRLYVTIETGRLIRTSASLCNLFTQPALLGPARAPVPRKRWPRLPRVGSTFEVPRSGGHARDARRRQTECRYSRSLATEREGVAVAARPMALDKWAACDPRGVHWLDVSSILAHKARCIPVDL